MTQKVKVYLPIPDGGREYLWATRIGADTAKLTNIPFFNDRVTLGDLVQFARNGRVLRVLERCGRTRFGRYEVGEGAEETCVPWQSIQSHLSTHDIPVESLDLGYFSMATPLDWDDEKVASVVATSPVPFEVFGLVAQ